MEHSAECQALRSELVKEEGAELYWHGDELQIVGEDCEVRWTRTAAD